MILNLWLQNVTWVTNKKIQEFLFQCFNKMNFYELSKNTLEQVFSLSLMFEENYEFEFH
jgi:hypothetical protein